MNIKFGIVEDVNDPLEAGRIRVRVFGVHSENLNDVPTEDLPWAQCMNSTYNGSIGGKGKSPTGILKGQLVGVVFLDPDLLQIPLVLGSFSGINSETLITYLGEKITRNESSKGFKQEIRPEYVGQPDTNLQARTGKTGSISRSAEAGVETYTPGVTWSEPASTMSAAVYPHSKIVETESGHIFETDDTPGNERILVYHKDGSYDEFSGSHHIVKIIGDDYEIIKGNKNLKVAGALNINVTGDVNLNAANVNMSAGTINLGAEGNSLEPLVMGDKLADWVLGHLMAAFNGHYHIGNLGAPTTVPINPLTAGEADKFGSVYSKNNFTQP